MMRARILTEFDPGKLAIAERKDRFLHVHTRNGDSIEIDFRVSRPRRGTLRFGYDGGFERTSVILDFQKGRAVLTSTDWSRPQPMRKRSFGINKVVKHRLLIRKKEAAGTLVKLANLEVLLDGESLFREENVDILPETGLLLETDGIEVSRFVHRGFPSEIPEFLHLGAWQMLNRPSLEENLASLYRGLREAAERGVQLLLTPETSLTGLFPVHRVTKGEDAIIRAEITLQKFMRSLPNAPHVIVGLPIWEARPGHRRKRTRFNVSRLYAPDGEILSTHPKIHSCEVEFCHGYRLHEFDVCGVPCCMHICHDGRYPEVWTLPVMFGARLVLHPSNGGRIVTGSIERFEGRARGGSNNSHAFYVNVNGGGGSFITSPKNPQFTDNLLARSDECRRDVATFPMLDGPRECLLNANIRVHDAFGYWPQRSFRASEAVAAAYLSLYRELGGRRVGE